MRTLLLMALCAWGSSAWAADWLPAKGAGKTVEVNTSTGASAWYTVESGQVIDFPFEGPATLTVEVRQQLADAGERASGLRVEAKGDGGRLPSIELGAPLDLAGAVSGDPGSLLTIADVGTYQVPGGKHILAIKAPSSGPRLLVRVGSVMDDAPAVTLAEAPAPVADEAPEGAEPAVAELGEEDEEPMDDLSALLATAPAESESSVGLTDDEPTLVGDLGSGDRSVSDMIKESSLGGRIGIGAPLAGSSVTPYVGVQWRVPVVADLLDVHLDVGWFWVGVNEDLAYQDPYGGPREIAVNYSTHVVPVALNGLIKLPVDLPVDIFGGVGVGLYILNRVDTDQSATAAAFGGQVFAGVDIPAGPGTLTPTFGYTATGGQLGRSTVEGGPAFETMSNFRLDLAYLFSF